MCVLLVLLRQWVARLMAQCAHDGFPAFPAARPCKYQAHRFHVSKPIAFIAEPSEAADVGQASQGWLPTSRRSSMFSSVQWAPLSIVSTSSHAIGTETP